MKRLAALLLIVVTSFTMCVCGAAGETTGELTGYTVISWAENTYLYAKPTDKSAILSAYTTGAEVGMLDYNIHETYAYVKGPDGKTGYIIKTALMQAYDYGNPYYRSYRVTSTFLGGVAYMYQRAGADEAPIKILYNDLVIKAVGEATEDMLLVVDSENTAGYVFKSFLTAEAAFRAEAEMCVAAESCTLYSMPVSGSVMLGEMNPGQTAQVVDWNAGESFAFVRDARTGRYGYALKSQLKQVER
ncbi:MAG: hypothetical protein K5784_09425 [Clostridiales bacterium]|nr:hypothetical protein [Clostridiales bacterium]